MHIYVCMYLCKDVGIYLCMYVYIYTYVYIYICVCVFICKDIYIYIIYITGNKKKQTLEEE